MRIARFYHQKKSEIKLGLIDGNHIQEIVGDIFSDYRITERIFSMDEVNFCSPVIPTKVICLGLNYAEHAQEMNKPFPKEPLIFMKPPSSVLGHKQKIVYPTASNNVHYEAELAVVIKDKIKDVSEERALEYVLGYTIGNDVTARDLQQKDGQWTRSKSFDTFCPLGPWIQTDITNPEQLDIKLWVNGEIKQKSNTSEFIFPIVQIIAFLSRIMTLNPGDVIMTGTPSGVGPLSKGDEVSIEIEPIGKLTNYVAE